MTATVTDLFCGAGGSSLGAEAASAKLLIAANHWQTAIDVHQQHFPNAGHDCADISLADPRRYPLLVPYNTGSHRRPVSQPVDTVTRTDRLPAAGVEQIIDDCGFRMLEPHEVAAAMAFLARYILGDLTKRDQVRLSGNAVTPPVVHWIPRRVLQGLEAAA